MPDSCHFSDPAKTKSGVLIPLSTLGRDVLAQALYWLLINTEAKHGFQKQENSQTPDN